MTEDKLIMALRAAIDTYEKAGEGRNGENANLIDDLLKEIGAELAKVPEVEEAI